MGPEVRSQGSAAGARVGREDLGCPEQLWVPGRQWTEGQPSLWTNKFPKMDGGGAGRVTSPEAPVAPPPPPEPCWASGNRSCWQETTHPSHGQINCQPPAQWAAWLQAGAPPMPGTHPTTKHPPPSAWGRQPGLQGGRRAAYGPALTLPAPHQPSVRFHPHLHLPDEQREQGPGQGHIWCTSPWHPETQRESLASNGLGDHPWPCHLLPGRKGGLQGALSCPL